MVFLASTNIKHKGLCNISELLDAIKDFIESHKYDFQAPKHKHKGDEMEIEYTGELKANDYVKFKLKVEIKVFEYKKLEIIKQGKKQTTDQARIEITVNAEYELDFAKRFRGSKFLQKLQDFYHKYVLKTTIEEVWEGILAVHYSQLVAVIKEKLGHETR